MNECRFFIVTTYYRFHWNRAPAVVGGSESVYLTHSGRYRFLFKIFFIKYSLMQYSKLHDNDKIMSDTVHKLSLALNVFWLTYVTLARYCGSTVRGPLYMTRQPACKIRNEVSNCRRILRLNNYIQIFQLSQWRFPGTEFWEHSDVETCLVCADTLEWQHRSLTWHDLNMSWNSEKLTWFKGRYVNFQHFISKGI